jgi:hypothetical protein
MDWWNYLPPAALGIVLIVAIAAFVRDELKAKKNGDQGAKARLQEVLRDMPAATASEQLAEYERREQERRAARIIELMTKEER